MPIIDEILTELPSLDVLHGKYLKFPYEFEVQLNKIRDTVHFIGDPLPYSRLLQLICKPSWFIDYFLDGPNGNFRGGVLNALQRIGARVTFHTQNDLIYCQPQDIVLSWHTMTSAKNRWNYKEAALPHLVSCDKLGYSGWSELANIQERELASIPDEVATNHFDADVQKFLKSRLSKYKQDNDATFTERDFIFLPLQLDNDTVVKLLYFGNYVEAVSAIVLRLIEAGFKVVLKRHPLCKSEAVAKMIGRLTEAGAILASASIHDIIPYAKAVVTMNSGVGFEALLYLKNVICFGKSEYSIVAHNLRKQEQLEKLPEMINTPPSEIVIKKYLFLAMMKYQVNINEPRAYDRQVLRMLCECYISGRRGVVISGPIGSA
jgi:hypothetical protein